MEENTYLIPANSKKSALIFGLFNYIDIIIFVTGSFMSLIMLLILGTENDIVTLSLMFSPAIITALLVMPFPNYHNVLNFLISIIKFFSNRRKYIWKGWNYNDKFKKL